MRKAVFLDRDGTLTNNKEGYLHKVEDCELLPGVVEGLNRLKEDFVFFIVTNQSGIGRGYYTKEDFWQFQNYLVHLLGQKGVSIEATAFCPHHPEANCSCRKPEPSMIYQLAKDHNICLEESWYIGDSDADQGVAENVMLNYVSLASDPLTDSHSEKVWFARDFHAAADIIQINKS